MMLAGVLCLHNRLAAQTILNGSFETNNQNCGYNLTNTVFNQSVPPHTAFGSQSEIDVINNNCGYGDAADGNDFIGLYSNMGSDSLALKLSAALDPGLTYTLQFYDKNGRGAGISTAKVQIGLSQSPDTFGDLLYEGPLTRFEWNLREVVFRPDAPYQYITATVSSTAEEWVFLDGFTFACPVIDLGPDTALCTVEAVELLVDPDFDQINWSTGSHDPVIRVDAPGQYWAEGISGGCLVRDSVILSEVEYDCDCSIYLPNAFSPNGDGINDTFSGLTSCAVLHYEMFIFNRWGELLFRTTDLSQSWDGTFGRQPAASGTYFYWISYQFPYQPGARIEKGELVLIR